MGKESSGNELNAACAKVLRDRKERQGLTFPQLAERTGISVRQLKRVINDERAMTTDDMVRCAAALGVSLTEVFSVAIKLMEQGGQT
jgi:transcriptional regulator with XRE-family HTH domain